MTRNALRRQIKYRPKIQLERISAKRMTLNNKTADHFFSMPLPFCKTHKLFVIYFNSYIAYTYISESFAYEFFAYMRLLQQIVQTDFFMSSHSHLLYITFLQKDRPKNIVYIWNLYHNLMQCATLNTVLPLRGMVAWSGSYEIVRRCISFTSFVWHKT